jgi:hypothetical protein
VISSIKPGETKKAVFLVKRGNSEATIHAVAEAVNSEPATSDTIPIPVFWPVIPLAVGSIVAVTYVARKR